MKKFLCFTLAIVMAALLVGCGFIKPNGDSDDANNPAKADLTRGTIEGDVYKNEYLGFSFTKPASWVYSTDEEIAAAVNVGAESMGENFKETLENSLSMYDMMVVDTITSTNINIGYENLAKSYATNITVEQYVEALKRQMANVSGMTVTFPESFETVTFGETEFTKVDCAVTVQGISMKQVYYLNKTDKYICFIIATIVSGYTAEQIEAMFQ